MEKDFVYRVYHHVVLIRTNKKQKISSNPSIPNRFLHLLNPGPFIALQTLPALFASLPDPPPPTSAGDLCLSALL